MNDQSYRNAGARAERACWIAHFRRAKQSGKGMRSVEEEIQWGVDRKLRYEKRAGGIGKRLTAKSLVAKLKYGCSSPEDGV
jgi:hypothetical protein